MLRHQTMGLPFVDEKIRNTEAKLYDLEKAVNGFSESLRKAAAQGKVDLTEMKPS